jgi:hypothetical protein
MARVRNNIVVRGLSGSLGDQVVIKHYRDGRTVVGKKPTFSDDRAFSKRQKGHQGAFREASAYAKQAARTEAIYAEKALGTSKTAYNVALADWFHPPEIEAIDLGGWMGMAGKTIRIKVVDDVKVTQVMVAITGRDGEVLEQGMAVQEDDLWWMYMTTQAVRGYARVVAAAQDLAGNITQATEDVQGRPVAA